MIRGPKVELPDDPKHREAALWALDGGAMSGRLTYISQAGVVIYVTGNYGANGRFVPGRAITADGHEVRQAPEGWDARATRKRTGGGWPVPRPRKPRKGAA